MKTGSHTQPDTQRILVVDDEAHVREMLESAFSFMGHKVEGAADGREALQKLAEEKFDVVVTDLFMPRMDGMALIRRMAEDYGDVDVIAITGYSDKYPYTEVIAAGAADFITKPFTLDKLEAKLVRLIRERRLRLQLEEMAIRDSLTGLFNRRHFEQVLAREAVRAVRYHHPLALIFIDLDGFKQYNDQFGHRAGDQLLCRLARVLEGSIREHVDRAFRYGGDEFTVILPLVDVEGGCRVARRIRRNFAELGYEQTTLSMGIAEFQAESGELGEDIEDLVRRADSALYHVKKRLGGNRACCVGDSLSDDPVPI